MNIQNHHTLTFDASKALNVNHPALSIKEDFRRGNYYIKHIHTVDDFTRKVFLVFKDNPCPGRNWRGDMSIHISLNDFEEAVNWVNSRRCFR